MTVTASDLGTPPLENTTTVTITIVDKNDVTPNCDPVLINVNVSENTSPNVNIATVTCPDTDTGTNGDVSYVIAQVDNVPAVTTPFQINSHSGAFDLASALDYESDKFKTVIIHAVDGGGLTGTVTINVLVNDVNEDAPVFDNGVSYTATVNEVTAVGALVFSATATDSDTDDVVIYSIDPASTVFEIDENTGNIYLITSLDYESQQHFTLTLKAEDGRGMESTQALAINIANSNEGTPVFNPHVYAVAVAENETVGVTVVTVIATDSDSDDTIQYSIKSGNGDLIFRIETSGAIIIDNIAKLDYETTNQYTVVVEGSDGTKTGTTTVHIAVTGVNEHEPTFGTTTSSTVTVTEDSLTISLITVTANDNDTGTDGEVTYSITAGNGDGLFAANPITGEVTLVGHLDRETKENYVITITATDGGIGNMHFFYLCYFI